MIYESEYVSTSSITQKRSLKKLKFKISNQCHPNNNLLDKISQPKMLLYQIDISDIRNFFNNDFYDIFFSVETVFQGNAF